MSNYVPRFSKKHEALGRKEYEMVERLIEEAHEVVLLKAADEVRLARIRAMREKLAKLPPVEGEKATQFHQLKEKIRVAKMVTVDEILSEFQPLAAKELRKRAAPRQNMNP